MSKGLVSSFFGAVKSLVGLGDSGERPPEKAQLTEPEKAIASQKTLEKLQLVDEAQREEAEHKKRVEENRLVAQTLPVQVQKFFHIDHFSKSVNEYCSAKCVKLLQTLGVYEIVSAFIEGRCFIFPYAFIYDLLNGTSQYEGRTYIHRNCKMATEVLLQRIVLDYTPARTYEELKPKIFMWAHDAADIFRVQFMSTRGHTNKSNTKSSERVKEEAEAVEEEVEEVVEEEVEEVTIIKKGTKRGTPSSGGRDVAAYYGKEKEKGKGRGKQ